MTIADHKSKVPRERQRSAPSNDHTPSLMLGAWQDLLKFNYRSRRIAMAPMPTANRINAVSVLDI